MKESTSYNLAFAASWAGQSPQGSLISASAIQIVRITRTKSRRVGGKSLVPKSRSCKKSKKRYLSVLIPQAYELDLTLSSSSHGVPPADPNQSYPG